MAVYAPSEKLVFAPGISFSEGDIKEAIDDVFATKTYPCIPAMLSYQKNEFMVGSYSDFGKGFSSPALYQDLRYFSQIQKKTGSLYMSYWAVFKGSELFSEDMFEKNLWSELSSLCSTEPESVPWDKNFSSNPSDPNFCISIGGEAFFVVGLHANSSRLARKFRWPTIIFNLYEQFEELDRQGRYQSIVQKNRAREIQIQGNINPMVEKYGDKWEAIQFSGRENPSTWKCPFHRFFKKNNAPHASSYSE